MKEILKKQKKKIIIGGVGVVMLLATFPLLSGKSPHESGDFIPLKKGKIVEAVYGIGTLTPVRSLAMKSGTTSGIRKIYVKEGDTVQKGQRLFELEGFVEFRAPFNGTVSTVSLKEGETVFAQSPILSVTDRSEVYLSASIEQQSALKVKPGMSVRLSFDGMRDKNFTGRVDAVYASASDFVARISVHDLPDNILPGMTADAAIILRQKEDVLLIPVAALQEGRANIRRGGSGRTSLETIKLGYVDGAMAEVISDNVKEGDEVLVKRVAGPAGGAGGPP